MQSLTEHLTEQFYDWEISGRGWKLYEGPLAPEPPFTPFVGHFTDSYTADAIDDGREHTLASGLIHGFGSLFKPRQPRPVVAEPPTPSFSFDDRDDLAHLQVILPSGVTHSKDIAEACLLNLAGSRYPLCFELLGTSNSVTVSFLVDERDADLVTTQLQNHFPDVIVTRTDDQLEEAWNDLRPAAIADLGLANEFMLPLQSYRSLQPDPLIGLIAALGSLRYEELGLLQIIFTPVRHPWAASIRTAVTAPDGSPFFANAPEFSREAITKTSSPLYGVVIRAAGQSETPGRDKEILRQLVRALRVAEKAGGNHLIPLINDAYEPDEQELSLKLRVSLRSGMILSLDELLTFVHLPGASVASPSLVREAEKTKRIPAACYQGSVRLGENTHASETVSVWQTDEQRIRHTYVLGASGTGKSTLLMSMVEQDMQAGRGVGVLDPHGDLVDDILRRVPEERVEDVVLLDLGDEEHPVPFNILSAHSDLEKNLLASDLAAAFQRLATSWGDQMTAVLSNAILAILESERGGTLADLRRFLVEKDFRNDYLSTVLDDEVVYYWQHEFGLNSGKPQGSVVTRLNTFLRPKPIRYMVAHGDNRLNVAKMMDRGKIFLARLPQGAIGEENAYLLGTLLVSAFHRSALCRQSQDARARNPFYLYIDEFHHFITPSMAQILSGARKYGLGLVLAHQELRQLESRDPEVASAVMTNPATQILFRLGDQDARRIKSRLTHYDASDLQSLQVGHAIARVERGEWDFNLRVPLPPKVDEAEGATRCDAIREHSRRLYSVPREEVEERIRASRPAVKPAKEKNRPEREPPAKREEPACVEPATQNDPPPAHVEAQPGEVAVPAMPSFLKSGPAQIVPSPEPTQGRGGMKHKALQRLIKHWAEGMGFRAESEKTILDGRGAVDVALTKGDLRIACEISVTTPTAHEFQNLTKCLQAGYSHVVMVSDDRGHLDAIQTKAREELDGSVLGQVSFMLPKEFFAFIESQERAATQEPSKIRGYRVSVSRADLDPKRRSAQIQSVKRTIARASLRRSGK